MTLEYTSPAAVSGAICFVLARGGSKRIPGKNIRLFCGRPMVYWPVRHARGSNIFDDVIISTDSSAVADAAVQAGASRYQLRPAALSDDHATTADVLRYELERHLERTGDLPTFCCCLYGTSALVELEHLQGAFMRLRNNEAELVMAVLPYSHPIERALQFEASGLLHYRQPAYISVRTQDIPTSYHDSGLFYFFDSKAFLSHGGQSFAALSKKAEIVSAGSVVDIDQEEDWELAELFAVRRKLEEEA